MTYIEIILLIISIIVLIVISCGHIYIAKQVMDFETRQTRNEKRIKDEIRAEVIGLIQKHNETIINIMNKIRKDD